MDSARALTDSAYGVITTLDDSGLPKDFVTSGLVPEAHQALENYLPEGLLVYRYLSALREPLRLSNYGEHIASLGLSDFLPISASSFLMAPIRHGGRAEGNIYLAKSAPGDEFTQEDEETLVMFASHAALVIANARRHHEEQRARADLEALINTSPVVKVAGFLGSVLFWTTVLATAAAFGTTAVMAFISWGFFEWFQENAPAWQRTFSRVCASSLIAVNGAGVLLGPLTLVAARNARRIPDFSEPF